ncbi:MAG: prenyltransferase [Candidatus Omnitrophota bacterium]|jgi:1,4-dihydroxy-2-naphthoate octaprenyltransferase
MPDKLKNFIQALRLPFVTASFLPFLFGSFIVRENFNFLGFIFGLLAVVNTHISANLINDYADSRTGADWHDKKFYQFFGGSKLIQQNVFSEKFYLATAIIFALVSAISVILLSVTLKSYFVLVIYAAIVILSWFYSVSPLRFSYNRVGEIAIFFLFGPALVMGGYFIQTGIFPDLKSFFLSLPFGIFTTTILFANEIPDFYDDQKSAKFTWVSLIGPKNSFKLYYFLIFAGFSSILLNVLLSFLNPLALITFLFIIPAVKAEKIIKKFYENKTELMQSSKLTIVVQNLVGACLVLTMFFF